MEATVGGVIATSFVAQHDWSTSSFFSVGDGDVMHEEGLLDHEAAAPCSIMDQEDENSGLKASCPSRTDSGVLDSGDQTPVCSFQRGGFMEMMEGCESSTASCTSSSHPSPAAANRRNADASAATILKWQQLLRDHPNDPMVPPFFLLPFLLDIPPTFSQIDPSSVLPPTFSQMMFRS
jgi:hypothetical protein